MAKLRVMRAVAALLHVAGFKDSKVDKPGLVLRTTKAVLLAALVAASVASAFVGAKAADSFVNM